MIWHPSERRVGRPLEPIKSSEAHSSGRVTDAISKKQTGTVLGNDPVSGLLSVSKTPSEVYGGVIQKDAHHVLMVRLNEPETVGGIVRPTWNEAMNKKTGGEARPRWDWGSNEDTGRQKDPSTCMAHVGVLTYPSPDGVTTRRGR